MIGISPGSSRRSARSLRDTAGLPKLLPARKPFPYLGRYAGAELGERNADPERSVRATFQQRYGRVGHVFQGRYGAELIRRHEHLPRSRPLHRAQPSPRGPVLAPGVMAVVELSSDDRARGTSPWLAVDDLLAPFSGGPTPAALRYPARLSKTDSALYAQRLNQPGSGDLVPGHGRGPGQRTRPRDPVRRISDERLSYCYRLLHG